MKKIRKHEQSQQHTKILAKAIIYKYVEKKYES